MADLLADFYRQNEWANLTLIEALSLRSLTAWPAAVGLAEIAGTVSRTCRA